MKTHISRNQNLTRMIPVDTKLSLAFLMDEAAIRAVLEENMSVSQKNIQSCCIGHIRYKPGLSCLVSYQIKYTDGTNDNSNETLIYAKCYNVEGFQKALKKSAQQKTILGKIIDNILTVHSHNTIIYEFPNDARLPYLKMFADLKSLSHTVSDMLAEYVPDEWQPQNYFLDWYLLRYKPESRFIVRCHTYWKDKRTNIDITFPFILRLERQRNNDAEIDVMKQLRKACADISDINIPNLLFSLPDRGLTAMESIDGVKLSTILKTERTKLAIIRSAQTLAKLHSCTISGLPVRNMSFHLQKIEQSELVLKSCGEEISKQANHILNRLISISKLLPPETEGFVHGDFHQGQVLHYDDKDWIIDFNCAHTGDITADIGNFLAQLKLLQIRQRLTQKIEWDQKFLESYQQTGNKIISKKRVKFWKAFGLYELAVKEFRRLKKNWPDKVTEILNECQNIIEE